MGTDRQENQPELFDLSQRPAAKISHGRLGRVLLHLRYDQLVLTAIAGLIGLTVIFACGVERGKQLARSERMWLARSSQAAPPTQETAPVAPERPPEAPASTGAEGRSDPPPAVVKPKAKTVVAAADGGSRYAVQVVTYSQARLAQAEMTRLRAKGEPVFLMMRGTRAVVYVGPFTSKTNASERLPQLRERYQDCFIRAL